MVYNLVCKTKKKTLPSSFCMKENEHFTVIEQLALKTSQNNDPIGPVHFAFISSCPDFAAKEEAKFVN